MINIVLFEPEIPPNTGNIIRLCANTGFKLHLVEPLGFSLEHKQMRRAGLDYAEYASVVIHKNYAEYCVAMEGKRIFACTTKATSSYASVNYRPDDVLLFGPETRGLPDSILQSLADSQRIRIPMQAESRSLNLSNAVAIIAFEAWRQLDFACSR